MVLCNHRSRQQYRFQRRRKTSMMRPMKWSSRWNIPIENCPVVYSSGWRRYCPGWMMTAVQIAETVAPSSSAKNVVLGSIAPCAASGVDLVLPASKNKISSLKMLSNWQHRILFRPLCLFLFCNISTLDGIAFLFTRVKIL